LIDFTQHHHTAIVNDSNATQMFTSKNMLSLRQSSNGGQNEAYIFFCEHFLKCIVGNTTFNKMLKLNLKLSEIATPSDEALGLLLLENNEFKWISEAQNKGNKSTPQEGIENIAKPKYTSGGRSKGTTKGLTRRYGGWKSDGIKRFNEFLDLVKEDRNKNGGWFDEIMKDRLLGVGRKRIQETEKDDEEWILAKNDLFDDVVVFPTRLEKHVEPTWNAADDVGDDDDDGDGGNDDDDDSPMHAEAV
jgi:ubiquitin C-terminal hydrolase